MCVQGERGRASVKSDNALCVHCEGVGDVVTMSGFAGLCADTHAPAID